MWESDPDIPYSWDAVRLITCMLTAPAVISVSGPFPVRCTFKFETVGSSVSFHASWKIFASSPFSRYSLSTASSSMSNTFRSFTEISISTLSPLWIENGRVIPIRELSISKIPANPLRNFLIRELCFRLQPPFVMSNCTETDWLRFIMSF